jgi:hypothetical protein
MMQPSLLIQKDRLLQNSNSIAMSPGPELLLIRSSAASFAGAGAVYL